MIAVGRALALVRDDVVHPGHDALPAVPEGTQDLEWLPLVGGEAADLVVITRDSNIRFKPAERAAFQAHKVRGFFLTGKTDLSRWGKLDLLVRSWDRMERAIVKNGQGPWAMAVTDGQLKDLRL